MTDADVEGAGRVSSYSGGAESGIGIAGRISQHRGGPNGGIHRAGVICRRRAALQGLMTDSRVVGVAEERGVVSIEHGINADRRNALLGFVAVEGVGTYNRVLI